MAGDWTQDPRFNHFWMNYRHGQSWYTKHQISLFRSKVVSTGYENSFLYWLLEQSQKHSKFGAQDGSSGSIEPSTSLTEVRKKERKAKDQEIEMEITEEMLEFLKTSMKHKKQRDHINVTQEVTYINVDEIPVEHSASDSQDHVSTCNLNETHYKDYVEIYGANAPRIQAMETAIQLNFRRNCDRKQPKLWPNMPLQL
ncbi:gem-associated protein 8 isoform X1 [Daphnia magna]|uniref:gem-associated protein 8 isoform X1 n=1 Tax=Daphnia magna TaxID=35525 RepID=UPI0006DDCBA1|nr:gem-associated protein 8 isoform X1 [Daphnia magna]XP_045034655.1 gem-associated protein 8 isoform X1 [Daphnia magna]